MIKKALDNKGGIAVFKKLKENNRGGSDLQFATATFLFMFVVCIGLLLDFWYVSSAKVHVLKSVEAAELYCLVTNAPKEHHDASADYESLWDMDLTSNQSSALLCASKNGSNEVENRVRRVAYLKEGNDGLKEINVSGLPDTIGQMGIRTSLKYQVKTMIRSPEQLFNFMRPDNLDLTATKWVSLTVTTKLVPMLEDVHIADS
jgi:hypothetical protein